MKRPPRRMPSWNLLVSYWTDNQPERLPNLLNSARQWDQPFCFHCGWRSPAPTHHKQGSWACATGWLERSHLQDRATGGCDDPSNIVPLCALCHRGMPEFPDSADAALTWLQTQKHGSCPAWWQRNTDNRWNGVKYRQYPGRLEFVNFYVRAGQQHEHVNAAFDLAEAGDRDGALELMWLAWIEDEPAQLLVDGFIETVRAEVKAS